MYNNFDNIPPEIGERPQWVLWKYETRQGNRTKVPYRPTTETCGVGNRGDSPIVGNRGDSPNAPTYAWARTFQGVGKSAARGTVEQIAAQLKTKGMSTRIADMRKAATALQLSRTNSKTIAVNGEWREELTVTP